jgi:F-type H+-transporting ATPase subunit epsilon
VSSSLPDKLVLKMRVLKIRVIGPDRVIFEGEASSIQYPGGDGLYGILRGHAPMITTVEPGLLRIKDESGKEDVIALARGFVSICKDEIEFAVDAGEQATEIDMDRAQSAAERARELIKSGTTGPGEHDLVRAQYALMRAMARLKASKHSSRT